MSEESKEVGRTAEFDAHDHDAAGCLDCDCNAAPWSSQTPCTCPTPPGKTQGVDA